MLRLQRGEPLVYLNPEDAEERGIEDCDTVRIYNDLDDLELQAKIYPSSEPGVARMYFAWERFQYPSRSNFNTLVGMYMKPTQLVQYPEDTGEHLEFVPNYWGPTGVDSDVRVEVERVEGQDGGETTTVGPEGGETTPGGDETTPNRQEEDGGDSQ
jgi:complex iron-sulfur molybdoenzyme family reductase subunit alpha